MPNQDIENIATISTRVLILDESHERIELEPDATTEEIEDLIAARIDWVAPGLETQWETLRATEYLEHDNDEEDEYVDEYEVEVEIEPEAPPCTHAKGHEWSDAHWLVGGLEDNPGVWSNDHGGAQSHEGCPYCGCLHVTGCSIQGDGAEVKEGERYEPGYFADVLNAKLEDALNAARKWGAEYGDTLHEDCDHDDAAREELVEAVSDAVGQRHAARLASGDDWGEIHQTAINAFLDNEDDDGEVEQ